MSFPYGQSVTHHVADTPATDVYRDEVALFTDHTDVAVSVQPGASLESSNNRTDVVTGDMAVVYAGAHPVSASDEFTLPNGGRYKVLGDPSAYHSPLTGREVTEVILRRIV